MAAAADLRQAEGRWRLWQWQEEGRREREREREREVVLALAVAGVKGREKEWWLCCVHNR
jgi:hypothetical protein